MTETPDRSTPTPAEGVGLIAFDVGGTTIKGRVFDAELNELASIRRTSPKGPALVDELISCSRELIAASPAAVAAVGVALPGLVDTGTGIVLRSVNLGLENLAVAGPLRDALGVPIAIGHDVAAGGEAIHRLDPGAPDPLVVVIGTGIAAVTFVNGRAVRGVSGQAGELGHVVVRPDGPLCACGRRGCLESIASGESIARLYTARTGRPVNGALEVVAALGHDEVADAVWQEAVDALADGLLGATALLAPGEVVLGGGLAEAGETLAAPVRAAMVARGGVLPVPPVRVSALGVRAGVLGAGLLARDLLEAS